MSINLYDFPSLHPESFQKELSQRFSLILKEGSFIEGPYNQLFQEEFASMQQAKFCQLVGNGTDALEISLLALGIKRGDKVGVPAITFFASAEAILNIGAIPVLIDIDPETALISPASLEKNLVTHDLKAIMPVHIFGLPAPMKELEQICQKHHIYILEDAAQAHGAFYIDSKKPIGSRNNLTTFSFYPTKNLSACGDAGAILCPKAQLESRIAEIKNHGRGSKEILGRNSRCDHMQAATLHLKLPAIEQQNAKRKLIAKKYHHAFQDIELELLPEIYLDHSSFHLYPVRLETPEKRFALADHLKADGIGSANFYDYCLSELPVLKEAPGDIPNALSLRGRFLCLPIHPFLDDRDVAKVVHSVKTFFT